MGVDDESRNSQSEKRYCRNCHEESMFPAKTSVSNNEGELPGSAEKAAVRWQLQADCMVDGHESLTKSVVNKDVMLPIGLCRSWKDQCPMDTFNNYYPSFSQK